jgi:HAL2 family 3'(2'),5'-bisphosphate nucleotidase
MMFEKELEIGKKAVLLSSRIIRLIQRKLNVCDSFSKADRSPVTVADFLSQAIICGILNDHFPDIPIVAEEDSTELKDPRNANILERIFDVIRKDDELNFIVREDNLFSSIDLGAKSPSKIFWTLDPIDGTKGFLRGEQFAVALALIIAGKVELGILGCPNLGNGEFGQGYLFYAVRKNGAEMLNPDLKRAEKIEVSGESRFEQMKFVQSYVSDHSDSRLQNQIAEILNIKAAPIHLDSQVKYGLIASGNAEIYLRIPNPKTPDYKEKIWDHAAGSLIVEEAGGVVTDIFGKKLDFSQGKTLKGNTGILATIPIIQDKILGVIQHLKSLS